MSRGPRWQRGLRGAASAVLAVALLWFALPRVTGTGWRDIADVLGRLDAAEVAALAAVWCGTLWLYGYVLTASLPGLRHAQAITVNVTGSAVSNLVPFGGALGLAVTVAMLRSWGFAAGAIGLSALVTGIWNVLAKLALPLLGLLALLAAHDVATSRLAAGAGIAAVLLAAALAVLAAALWREGVAVALGRALQAVGHGVLRLVGSARRLDWEPAVPRLRHQVIGLVRGGWVQLTLGLAGFLGAQAGLLYLILHLLGAGLGPAQVFAGFAFGRLLTTLVVTPGGVGFAETGSAGLLVALGGDPAVCASGVLLFSGFVVVLEIPAGALGYLVWMLRRSWRTDTRPPGAAAPGPGSAG